MDKPKRKNCNHVNTKKNKQTKNPLRVSIFVSDRVDLKTINITRYIEEYYILIKLSNYKCT